MEPPNKIVTEDVFTHQEGGAVTSYNSTVIFIGVSSLLNNQASRGGAILATESTVIMQGKTTIAHNMATNSNGGGIYLYQSNLEIKGNYCLPQSLWLLRVEKSMPVVHLSLCISLELFNTSTIVHKMEVDCIRHKTVLIEVQCK